MDTSNKHYGCVCHEGANYAGNCAENPFLFAICAVTAAGLGIYTPQARTSRLTEWRRGWDGIWRR